MSDIKKMKLMKILLIEDDDAHAKIINRTFSKERIANELIRASDGEEGLDYLFKRGRHLDSEVPDLILLDLNLPKISGLDVLREIKSNEKLKVIPVVVLTTSNADRDKAEAYKLNANSYLVKPADPESFRRMVSDLNLYWGIWNQAVDDQRTGGTDNGVV